MFFPFLLLERKAKNQIIWHQKLLSIITNYEKKYANPIKIKNCRLKSSLVLPNTINQSFYVTMYYNVLKKIGIKNWDQFSAQVLSPYIKQSNIAFFDEKRYFDPWQYRGKYPRLSRGRPGFNSPAGRSSFFWKLLDYKDLQCTEEFRGYNKILSSFSKP